jgi:hypothetical protein
MWPFKKSGEDYSARAQTASAVLIGVTQEAAPHLLKALVGEERVDENHKLLALFTTELLIFGLHLTDRIAFSHLGASKRSGFMNVLLPAVQRELRPPLSSQLEQLYNARNSFYGSFPKLYADENENLKGTLFCEFGKALGSVYANSNPVAVTQTSMLGMTFMQGIQEVQENKGLLLEHYAPQEYEGRELQALQRVGTSPGLAHHPGVRL